MSEDERQLPTTLENLPSKFEYIRNVTLNYTRARRDSRERWKTFVASLKPGDLQQIAEVYQTIEERGDARELSSWTQDQYPEVRGKWDAWLSKCDYESELAGIPPPPEPQQQPRVERLFELFDYLHSLGIEPFKSGKVKFDPEPRNLDWSKLPPELAYLKDVALKWGHYQFSDDLLRLSRRLTTTDRQELKAIAQRSRTSDQERLIREFLQTYRLHIHPESALVYFALAVVGEFSK